MKIGKYVSNGNTYVTRCQYEYDLSSIDDHAVINRVTVSYITDEKNYSFKITEMSNAEIWSQEIWDAVENGTVLHSGRNYGFNTFDSNPIKSCVSTGLEDDILILGIMSEQEDSLDSGTDIEMTIEIFYTIPILNVTVRNNLYGANGGIIGAAIFPEPANSHASPYSFTAYEEDKLNLQAYDNQSIDNKIWFFNDTEYGEESSEWEKKKSSGFLDVLTNSHEYTTDKLTSSNLTIKML